ncbi:tetratricopeptide repeat protein [Fervidibacter sacchari]
MQFGRPKGEMTANREFDELAAEFEAQGLHREAELLRRFPRTAWDDELVKGMFVASVSIRDTLRAEKVAQQLVRFAPENPFAYLALCLVKLKQGQTHEAAKAFDRALHFASTFPTYRAQKIHWLCLQGKLDEARQVLRDTMKEYADRWEVQRARAHVLVSSERQAASEVKRAIELLERLVRLYPNDPITHALLAQAVWRDEGRGTGDEEKEGRQVANSEWRMAKREQAMRHLRLMAKNLPTLNFTDVDAFIAWEVANQTLAECFPWLKPNWLLERFFVRWLPPRYFVAVGILWGTVATLLAIAKLFLPPTLFASLVAIASLAFVYNRFAVPVLVWLLAKGT